VNGTTGICNNDLNFCIRVDWAAASDSEVVGEGVGGRIRFSELAGSTVRIWVMWSGTFNETLYMRFNAVWTWCWKNDGIGKAGSGG